MGTAFVIIFSVWFIYFLIMIPFQYKYISAIKDQKTKMKQTHEQMFDNMSFEEQQLHFHLQGSIFTLPSSIAAAIIYKIRHRFV